mgnify:CR=1 FL=1
MLQIAGILKKLKVGEKVVYRGHADSEWELKPSIGRHYTNDWKGVLGIEKKSLADFKKKSVPHLKHIPKSDIEWLCLMQHYGLSTRLLDFTTNPLIALFFTTDPAIKKDGELITAEYSKRNEAVANNKLFNNDNNFSYHPPHITERIIGQNGIFVYSRVPNSPLNEKQISRIPIPKEVKADIRKELVQLGISNASLFPSIDGICNDLNDNLIDKLCAKDIAKST